MKEEKKTLKISSELKAKANAIIKKSKELNIIKSLNSAFEVTPCEKEEHKGKKEYFLSK